MISKDEAKRLKKHRHIVAAMINESIGYFTPLMALRAIEAHKAKKNCYCEWYLDIAAKRNYGKRYDEMPSDTYTKINRDIIRYAFRRCHRGGYKGCLAIVDRNIAGHESIGASWF